VAIATYDNTKPATCLIACGYHNAGTAGAASCDEAGTKAFRLVVLFWGGGKAAQKQVPSGKGGIYIPQRNGAALNDTVANRKLIKLMWVGGPIMNSMTIKYTVSYKASF